MHPKENKQIRFCLNKYVFWAQISRVHFFTTYYNLGISRYRWYLISTQSISFLNGSFVWTLDASDSQEAFGSASWSEIVRIRKLAHDTSPCSILYATRLDLSFWFQRQVSWVGLGICEGKLSTTSLGFTEGPYYSDSRFTSLTGARRLASQSTGRGKKNPNSFKYKLRLCAVQLRQNARSAFVRAALSCNGLWYTTNKGRAIRIARFGNWSWCITPKISSMFVLERIVLLGLGLLDEPNHFGKWISKAIDPHVRSKLHTPLHPEHATA